MEAEATWRDMVAEAAWRGEHPECDGRVEGLTHLEAIDALNDLRKGVRHWLQTKVGSGKWDEYDESLTRWIDVSEIELD